MARAVGFWPTLGLVVATGLLGALLVRAQSGRAFGEIRRAWQEGRVPGTELVAAALFLVAAAFLLTPGVLTDATGLLLMAPSVRRAGARAIVARFGRRFVAHGRVRVVEPRNLR